MHFVSQITPFTSREPFSKRKQDFSFQSKKVICTSKRLDRMFEAIILEVNSGVKNSSMVMLMPRLGFMLPLVIIWDVPSEILTD